MIDDWIIRNPCGDTLATPRVRFYTVFALSPWNIMRNGPEQSDATVCHSPEHFTTLLITKRLQCVASAYRWPVSIYNDPGIVSWYCLFLCSAIISFCQSERPRWRDGECRAFLVLLLLFCKYYYRRQRREKQGILRWVEEIFFRFVCPSPSLF